MKLPKLEFKKLQQHWNEILYLSGFCDIERLKNDELIIINPESSKFGVDPNSQFNISMKEEYFRCISQISNDEKTVFKNETHRYILIRHSEGAKIQTIIKELVSHGTSRTKESVRCIIRKYEMRWGLRTYTDKQLRKYK